MISQRQNVIKRKIKKIKCLQNISKTKNRSKFSKCNFIIAVITQLFSQFIYNRFQDSHNGPPYSGHTL